MTTHAYEGRRSPAMWMSLTLALLAATASGGGLFRRQAYLRESPAWAAQLKGVDAVTLFIAVPVLILSVILARRGSVPARMVWQGSLLLLLYNYAIYAFAVHFNTLFLAYCGVLGLSFYAFLESLLSSPTEEVAARYGPRAPVRTLAVAFFLLALAFAAQGMAEIVPALLAGHAPQSITECGLLSNPTDVLDLSLFLPAYVIAGVLLWRRRPLGFVLAPVLMAFTLLMTLTIAGLMVATALQGFANDYRAAVVFLAAAIVCALLLLRFFRSANARASGSPRRAENPFFSKTEP